MRPNQTPREVRTAKQSTACRRPSGLLSTNQNGREGGGGSGPSWTMLWSHGAGTECPPGAERPGLEPSLSTVGQEPRAQVRYRASQQQHQRSDLCLNFSRGKLQRHPKIGLTTPSSRLLLPKTAALKRKPSDPILAAGP